MDPIPQLDRLVALAGSLGALVDAVDAAGHAFTTRVQYPRVFGEFVERYAFVAFDVGGIRIYSNIQGAEDGLEELLADKILTRELVNAGFLPFGRPATGSYDRICFDVRGTQDPDDAPVVLMDHEAILSKNRMPKPKRLADGLVDLVDRERQKAGPFAPLVLALLLCGCAGPEHVSPAKFKAQYATVGQAGTMQTAQYLGQRDGRAFIRVRSMSVVSRKWSDLPHLRGPFRA